MRVSLNEIRRRVETPREHRLGSLARADEHHEQRLIVRSGKAAEPVHPHRDPAIAARLLLGGIENWLYGTAVTYTSAPATSRPPHADTWKRTESPPVEIGIGFGDTWKRSTSRRAGGVSWPTLIGPLPPGSP